MKKIIKKQKHIMLTKLLYCASVFTIMHGCSSFSGKAKQNGMSENDTVVCCKHIAPEYSWKETEFFVVTNQDTSAYSCLLSNKKGVGTNIELLFSKNEKLYFLNTPFNEIADITAIGDIKSTPKRNFYIPTYKALLNEIDLCLGKAHKEYDLDTLRYFSTRLSYLSDIAVLTKNILDSTFIMENDTYSHIDITRALKMTTFENDLNSILKKHNAQVARISCQEMRINIPKDSFLKIQNISNGINIPDSIVDVEVSVKLKQANLLYEK